MGQAQLDITFLSQEQNLLGVLTMTSNPDRDPILLEGTVSNLIRGAVLEVFMEIPQSAISALSLTESDNSLTLINDEGEPTEYGASSYSAVSVIDERYVIHSGVFSGPGVASFDFIASTDPVPTIVIILGVSAAACLLAIGLQALIDDCKNSMLSTIQECANSGGLPSLRANVVFGFGRDAEGAWRVGCTHECAVECRQ